MMIANAFSRRAALAPVLTPFAHACVLLCALACNQAVAQQALPEVTVTGSRFDSDPGLRPIGASVISADEIRQAGVSDVNAAIRKLGGVTARQSLDGSPDFALDLRGFGSNSGQNLVVLVDGVRMNDNDLGSTVLSTIPIDLVERIEIVRGGSSVLYGEGATGGVIQVFTKRAAGTARGSISAEVGRFDARDVRASATTSWQGFTVDAAVNKQKTDNWREHSAFDLDTANLGAQWNHAGGRIGLRVERAQSESAFPGSLTRAQFDANPRASFTLQDNGSVESNRTSAFIEHRVGTLDLAAELSRRHKHSVADYYFPDLSRSRLDSRQEQFSPRLRHLAQLGGILNELVAGVDLTRWERATTASYSLAQARQKSRAVYVRDEIKAISPHNARLALGVRRELFEKDSSDIMSGSPSEHARQDQNAWEVQGSVDIAPLLNLYAKTGRSYRVPNADENGYRSTHGVLAIQTSRDLEAGLVWGDSSRRLTARAFRHQLTNEIFFDPTLLDGWGANTNLDPTERKGIELEAEAALAAGWRASAQYQHVKASFREGPNAGREMVQVPRNALTTRVTWIPASGHLLDAGVQWVSSQRYGNDFTNACRARVPSYHTLDARYARKIGAWEFAVSGLNLTDERYYSHAFACEAGIYPSNGRQLKASLRYDF